MGTLEYLLIFGAIAFAVIVVAIVLVRKVNGKPAPRIVASAAPLIPPQGSMLDDLRGGGPRAEAIIRQAYVEHDVRDIIRRQREATEHLLAAPAPAPNAAPSPPSNPA
jgi:hypothetical protein